MCVGNRAAVARRVVPHHDFHPEGGDPEMAKKSKGGKKKGGKKR
jgi:hypothetical protein